AAGCRFQTYYPITPASDESEYLEGRPETGIVVVQTEDEIAAITMAVGAALTGVRSSTATSGPGFCLMAEGLGWAGINEVPIVVINYQRAGPSTGLPTRHEQGDLKFALSIGHGDFPRFVAAPGDLDECFHMTIDCFNWADRYQMPVIFLPDKALANNSTLTRPFDASVDRIDRGKLATAAELAVLAKDGGYKRYAYAEDGISLRSVLGQEHGIWWATGDEHTEHGHITEDPVIRDRMMEKRQAKLDLAIREIPREKKVAMFGPEKADVSILSWGSTKGAILDAMRRLKDEGGAPSVNYLHVKLLHPFPMDEVMAFLAKARVKVGIEQNFGAQFASYVREKTGVAMDQLVLKYNGRPMTEDEIVDSIKTAGSKKVPKVVLTHGV
ncbi:MAG: 2-oxoglutarate ferredoxin oxidoreductase subunit alpha, partial [Methanobacteriota archaeon]